MSSDSRTLVRVDARGPRFDEVRYLDDPFHWGVAPLRLQPFTNSELETIRRFRSGEDVRWSSPAEYRAARSE